MYKTKQFKNMITNDFNFHKQTDKSTRNNGDCTF